MHVHPPWRLHHAGGRSGKQYRPVPAPNQVHPPEQVLGVGAVHVLHCTSLQDTHKCCWAHGTARQSALEGSTGSVHELSHPASAALYLQEHHPRIIHMHATQTPESVHEELPEHAVQPGAIDPGNGIVGMGQALRCSASECAHASGRVLSPRLPTDLRPFPTLWMYGASPSEP